LQVLRLYEGVIIAMFLSASYIKIPHIDEVIWRQTYESIAFSSLYSWPENTHTPKKQ
jgi:hypothetical protein